MTTFIGMRRPHTKNETGRIGMLLFGVPMAILFACLFVRISYGLTGRAMWSGLATT